MSENGENGEKAVSQSSPSRAHKKFHPAKKAVPARQPVVIEWIDCPPTVIERVEFIADIMYALQWERGKTGKKLAKHWGIELSSIEKYAAEASRRVIGDRESAQRDITAVAHKLLLEALQSGSAKDAKMMGDLLAAVSGANAPQKQEIAHTLGEATPKTARDVMADVFKGDIGAGAREDAGPVPVPDSSALADPESD